ncbi:amidase signature domain-containing protein [Phaeosphaeriaceae sp. PMI808]|nr:amidase signature domain-containing protein [Phaeosphaeriaceae sp. PMI808]
MSSSDISQSPYLRHQDAIATKPSLEVATTLGSLALKNSTALKSAGVVARLEEMGAIVLGKTNLNEFCSFKCTESISSIVMPASRAGLYALKPALRVVDMEGVFRCSVDLDVVGGLARSTVDLALLSYLSLIKEKRESLPPDGYQKFLTQKFDALNIGFLDPKKWSLYPNIV